MSENNDRVPEPAGDVYLFAQPQMLSAADHAGLALSVPSQPFAFAAAARVVPLMVAEFRSAQKHCPIVFTDIDNPLPLAVLGVVEDANLFLDEDLQWQEPGYVPAYLRCHPLTLVRADERLAVVIDRAAASVTSADADDAAALFDGTELTAATQARVDFCTEFQAERDRTREFADTLKRLELLKPQQITQTVDDAEQQLAAYYAIDADRLSALDAATVHQLFRDGWLAAIFAHLYSLDTWSDVLRRRREAVARRAG